MAKKGRIAPKPRRRPVQSRSQQTSIAIQDAFVRLLDETPYARLTIREIVMVAGVGLGTFYDYFDSKDDLARTVAHLRTKALLQALRRGRAELAAYDLAAGVGAAIDSQLATIGRAPREWAHYFLLERQKTDLEYYRSAYELFVEEWRRLIAGAVDWPAGGDAAAAARIAFATVYGALAHAMLGADGAPDFASLRLSLARAALACVAAVAPAR